MDGHGEVGQGMEHYSKAGGARRGMAQRGWVGFGVVQHGRRG
jgi:hypothetical protein